MNLKKIKKYLYLLIILLIASLNFNMFLKPLHLVTGGTQGLAIVLNNITKLNHSTLILIINLTMLILSYLLLSKKATLGTVLATFFYPLFVKLTNNIAFSFDILILNVITAGIISGFTNGYIYKLGFTAGGINTLGPILNKYFHISVGTINFIINGIILFLGCFMFGFKDFFYSLIVLLINSIIINLVLYKKILNSNKIKK